MRKKRHISVPMLLGLLVIGVLVTIMVYYEDTSADEIREDVKRMFAETQERVAIYEVAKEVSIPVQRQEAEEKFNEAPPSVNMFVPEEGWASIEVPSSAPVAVPLIKVQDANTLIVEYEGREQTVQLLLIDAPAHAKKSKIDAPYVEDAYSFAADFFSTKTVVLEFDLSSDTTNRDGQLMAYAWVEDRLYNREIIRAGWARVGEANAPDTRYLDEFSALEEQAKTQGIGIWSSAAE